MPTPSFSLGPFPEEEDPAFSAAFRVATATSTVGYRPVLSADPQQKHGMRFVMASPVRRPGTPAAQDSDAVRWNSCN
ncbi:MAG: hypothetical protein LC808_32955, partial [Actinobacteria bacterium]|nr:hypothetical protein [Actinomycetota bacterium]